jgi:DNA-binding MarR family transcriptional regulator
MNSRSPDACRAVLCRSGQEGLTPAQRIVVMLYCLSESDRAGVVVQTGQDLARQAGMSPTTFSRVRRQLVEAGWLEPSRKFAHITYFRLSPHALGEPPVVAVRRVI